MVLYPRPLKNVKKKHSHENHYHQKKKCNSEIQTENHLDRDGAAGVTNPAFYSSHGIAGRPSIATSFKYCSNLSMIVSGTVTVSVCVCCVRLPIINGSGYRTARGFEIII